MIVCSCNYLDDKAIKSKLEEFSNKPSVDRVFKKIGCSVKCGFCSKNIKQEIDKRFKDKKDIML